MQYFKGKQFKNDIILVAVGYYCRYCLSYRYVSQILKARGVSVHPTTIMHWVHEQSNSICQMWKKKKSVHFVWHLDATYIRIKEESGVIFIVRLIREVSRWLFNFAKGEITKLPICL